MDFYVPVHEPASLVSEALCRADSTQLRERLLGKKAFLIVSLLKGGFMSA